MDRTKGLWRYSFTRAVVLTLFLAIFLLGLVISPYFGTTANAHPDTGSCHLNSARGNIQHVIYIQFDNTHFTRDNPNVPSDLEQMPHLLNFIKGNGVLLSNHHTPLIAHTATDILTSLTGVYADRHGVPVSNTFQYFNPDGTTNTGVSLAYWTAPIFDPATSTPTDTTFNMLSESGKNDTGGEVDFHACNSTNSSSERASFLTSPPVSKTLQHHGSRTPALVAILER